MNAAESLNPYAAPERIESLPGGRVYSWRFPLLLLAISWITSLGHRLITELAFRLMIDQGTAAEFARFETVMYFVAPIFLGAIVAKLTAMSLFCRNAATRSRRYTAAAVTILVLATFLLEITGLIVHLSGRTVTPDDWFVYWRMYSDNCENLLLLITLCLFSRDLPSNRIRGIFIAGIFVGTGLVPFFLLLSVLGVQPVFPYQENLEVWSMLIQFGRPFAQIATTFYVLRQMKRDERNSL